MFTSAQKPLHCAVWCKARGRNDVSYGQRVEVHFLLETNSNVSEIPKFSWPRYPQSKRLIGKDKPFTLVRCCSF